MHAGIGNYVDLHQPLLTLGSNYYSNCSVKMNHTITTMMHTGALTGHNRHSLSGHIGGGGGGTQNYMYKLHETQHVGHIER